ncbi:N-acetylglucosaminyl-phosphatidylinositol de-N-acetylase-like protein [Hyaloraphidium curvatum]|nr:N-acetylglucosaminyl-phosphatidylinositol de-N-acetylase-like protein [Hyaloraphidium curvatum]
MLLQIVLAFLIPALLYYIYLARGPDAVPPGWNRVLLVTAHPDDECMFFGPTLVRLAGRAAAESGPGKERTVRVLCLSTGNGDSLGYIRTKELVESCKTFGIPLDHVEVLDHPELQDGMNLTWDPELVGRIVAREVEKHRIDTVLTFDGHGVSGHPNHRACYAGVRSLVVSTQPPKAPKAFALRSVSLLRKYSAFADVAMSRFLGDAAGPSFVATPVIPQAAMLQHRSQLVWFRRIYVWASRYMYANGFRPIGQGD